MRKEDLIRAIGEVDDRLIEEAYNYQEEKKPFFVPWLKYGLGFACMVALSVVVIKPFTPNNTSKENGTNVMVVNPWSDYASVAEASKATGIDIIVDETVVGTYGEITARGMGHEIVEVNVINNDEKMMIRKGTPKAEELSGDYGTYEETIEKETADGRKVTLKMNGSDAYLAEWNEDVFSYVVSSSKGIPVDEMIKVIDAIH